jgi:hypothetical protein
MVRSWKRRGREGGKGKIEKVVVKGKSMTKPVCI